MNFFVQNLFLLVILVLLVIFCGLSSQTGFSIYDISIIHNRTNCFHKNPRLKPCPINNEFIIEPIIESTDHSTQSSDQVVTFDKFKNNTKKDNLLTLDYDIESESKTNGITTTTKLLFIINNI